MTTTNPLAYAVFPSFNNKTPKEGPRYIPMTFDFTKADTWEVDLMQIQQQGKISTLQAFYIDNSENTQELFITMGLGGQVIKVQPGYQGYMTALVNNVPKFSVSSPGGVSAIVFALNFPVVNDLWPAAPNASDAEHVIVDNFPDPQNVNMTEVGGDAISLGQKVMSASLPVVLASDQLPLTQNLTEINGAAISLGQKTSSASIPVVLPSDAVIAGISTSIEANTVNTTTAQSITSSSAKTLTFLQIATSGFSNSAVTIMTIKDGSGTTIATLGLPILSDSTYTWYTFTNLNIALNNASNPATITLSSVPSSGAVVVATGWQ